jgi:hypothetical protein
MRGCCFGKRRTGLAQQGSAPPSVVHLGIEGAIFTTADGLIQDGMTRYMTVVMAEPECMPEMLHHKLAAASTVSCNKADTRIDHMFLHTGAFIAVQVRL